LAVNKLTGEEDLTTAAERDRMVKWVPMKTNSRGYSFKRGEIYKNMALILVDAGKTEEAKKGD
jgi:hypothetical protein